MATLRLFQTYDNVAKTIIGPLIATATEQAAIRIFTDALKNENALGKHPDDYDLLEVGTIDPDTAEITAPHLSGIITTLKGRTWLATQNGEGR